MMQERHILLVEDNPDDEALTIRAFRKNHVRGTVAVARDGQEALDRLLGDAAIPLPQLVLLDLKLPKIDGFQVLQRLRANERTRLVPVVILTSSREDADLASGYRLGANSYIRKPVDFDAFATAIRELGSYWLELNEPPPPTTP